MLRVAVDAPDLVVHAVGGLALGDVLAMEGGEVVTCTGAALGSPRAANVSGVTPLVASGALAGGGGYRPLLASPNNACK